MAHGNTLRKHDKSYYSVFDKQNCIERNIIITTLLNFDFSGVLSYNIMVLQPSNNVNIPVLQQYNICNKVGRASGAWVIFKLGGHNHKYIFPVHQLWYVKGYAGTTKHTIDSE